MTTRTRHTPHDILKAATLLFFHEGVAVTTARIAAASGVSNGTLFNYFPTKQELIDALYVSIKADLGEAVGEFNSSTPLDIRMRQVWDRWLAWERGHRVEHFVANLLLQSGLATPAAQEVGNAAISGPAEILLEAKESGLLIDLPLEYIAVLIQHHLEQVVAFELDAIDADLAYLALWNCITRSE